MAVKLSELKPGQMINHDGDVIYKNEAIELVKSGKQRAEFYTVSPAWIQNALKSAWRDSVEEVEGNDSYTASDSAAELIIVDSLI